MSEVVETVFRSIATKPRLGDQNPLEDNGKQRVTTSPLSEAGSSIQPIGNTQSAAGSSSHDTIIGPKTLLSTAPQTSVAAGTSVYNELAETAPQTGATPGTAA